MVSENQKYWVAGFVAGEGCFYWQRDTTKKEIFQFCVDVHKRDPIPLHTLTELFGGEVLHFDSRGDMIRYQITSLYLLAELIIPFMDKYLCCVKSHKNEQYLEWRAVIVQRHAKAIRKPKQYLVERVVMHRL